MPMARRIRSAAAWASPRCSDRTPSKCNASGLSGLGRQDLPVKRLGLLHAAVLMMLNRSGQGIRHGPGVLRQG